MTLPEIRHQLIKIAADARVPSDLSAEIVKLAMATKKRRSKRSQTTSRKMTSELREAVHAYHAAHPTLSQFAIATHFGINQGRVSETLRGFRT